MLFIGIPLLYLTIITWWGMAVFEGVLVRHWLQIDIPVLPSSLLKITARRPGLRVHLSQGITWKTLIYLLAKGPFSLCVGMLWPTSIFCSGVIGILILSVCLLAFPLFALWGVFALLAHQSERIFIFSRLLFQGSIALILLPFNLLDGMADLWGHFARLMLTIDERERALMEARETIKRERARADRAEQQRRDLIANLSHDLRTPVANIRGHAEALLQLANETTSPSTVPEHQQAYLTIIHREAIRLGTLFDELLALAREEAHELHLSMTAVRLQEVIEEVYQTLKPLAYSERRITVGKTIAPGLPAVQADRQRVQQVLLNLVRNAITYTPHGGLVAITLQQADQDHLVLAVADTGMGIAPAHQAHIFERFYRPEDVPTGGGVGLGLAIVRELIEAMGGSVAVESSVGEGSCFSVRLPIA
ncbi:ATP-binding protein [Ktedonospora formicarum]|uniref:histidine kinase n=1 Tax=Ktedonospora formicarum TaxID=2778364 RepID=A0A8J3I592_9CHLR|nr:ATP-binding protein [Ktedonospora formicarum]GHO50567.1 hypothetical protein KSX_87300 [Ktedonospora formicarum]